MTIISNRDLEQRVIDTRDNHVPIKFRPTRPLLPRAPVAPVGTPVPWTPPPTPSIGANPSGKNGIPKALISLVATQTPVKQQSYTNSNITINFTSDPSDTNFYAVDIWFIGYHGNSNPQLMSSGNTSPINFVCDSTGESVSVFAQTVSATGMSAPLVFATHTVVTLSGTVDGPPPPTIAQTLVATPTGYQFSFNFITGLLTDVISVYRVYRNTTNTFVNAAVIATVPQNTNGSATYVFQDNIGSQNLGTLYYWVSAVNTAGLESGLTSAQAGAVLQTGWLIPTQQNSASISVPNANFEASTVSPVGWVPSGGKSLFLTTSFVGSGTQSLRVGSGGAQFGGAISTQQWAVKPGDQFFLSALMSSDGTSSPSAVFVILNGAGTQIAFISAQHGVTGAGYTTTTGTGTAPAGSVAGYVSLQNDVASALGDAYFDNIIVDRMVDPTTTVAAKGSTPSSLTSGFTYTSTTTTVTISWTGLTIYRADGTTTAVANGSQVVTGLTLSTSYKVYPYYDELLGTVNFVTGGVGSPAICQSAGSNTISQAQNLQSRVPLSASNGFTVTTPASGAGGGSGGGSGSCLHEDMLVRTDITGIVRVIDAEIGENILGEHGWEMITDKKILPAEIWVRVQLTSGREITVSSSHPFTLPEGSNEPMKRAQDLCLADFLITSSGVEIIKLIEAVESKARKVALTTAGPSHAFFAGKDSPAILAHNFLPS